MLTAATFPSLTLGLQPTLDSSASLTGCHAVQHLVTELEGGSFLMGQLFLDHWEILHHSLEPEEMMEQST